jgi:hypothetical protein
MRGPNAAEQQQQETQASEKSGHHRNSPAKSGQRLSLKYFGWRYIFCNIMPQIEAGRPADGVHPGT